MAKQQDIRPIIKLRSTAGTGYTLVVGSETSFPFDISADGLKKLRYDSLAFFYHQRSGIAIDARYVGATYARLRSLAVGRGEFTVVRDRFGAGVQYFLLRDEVSIFGTAGLIGLRRFRAREERRRPGHSLGCDTG